VKLSRKQVDDIIEELDWLERQFLALYGKYDNYSFELRDEIESKIEALEKKLEQDKKIIRFS
jgi:peptidoglycan hydrolase CwlO-like protein